VREWAQILRKAGWYAWAKGDYSEAERMCGKPARALQKVVGRDEVETLHSLWWLAVVYRDQGRWSEAETTGVQVVETIRVLGEEYPDPLTSMNNLSCTRKAQGRDVKTHQLMAECVQLRVRVLGAEHPHCLSSATVLAEWQRDQNTSDK
jgi:Tetratricopeptide repeat